MEDGEILWARVAPEAIIVATPGRAFVHAPDIGGGGPFTVPHEGKASREATRRLLDGAVGAAQRAFVPSAPQPPLTPARWAYRLAGYFRTTHVTPQLMREAATRFHAQGREALCAWAERKVRDEHGHDALALRDLEALGYEARALVEAIVPPTAQALADLFAALVHADDPAGCAGYAYALERLAATRGPAEVRAVQAILPPGTDATRCLRVHSASGSDGDHAEDIVEIASGLSHREREIIAAAAYEATRIGRVGAGTVGAGTASLAEGELGAMLARFRRP